MSNTRWGILGPGAIAHNFADGLAEAPSGRLVAIASRDEGRRTSFGDTYQIAPEKRHSTYDALADDPDVDAIYISTPQALHAAHALMALRAGKHVLCEKPAAITAAQVTAMTEVAAQEGVFFMEAMMYRCHPQIARLVDIIRSGEIGTVEHVRASFGFRTSFNPASRVFDRALGGGAILDVGVYPVSLARLVAGVAVGKDWEDPDEVKAVGRIGRSGVDEEAYALLRFPGGVIAECATAIRRAMDNTATIIGTEGRIHLPNPWTPGRNAGPSDAIIDVTVGGETRREEIRQPEHLFAFEAEVASRAVAAGAREPDPPAAGWGDSIGNAATLDRWRREIGYAYGVEDRAPLAVLPSLVPGGLPKVTKNRIDGVDQPVSSLIMGCDNKATLEDGAVVWDAWMEAGGNAFDTAFIYGGGDHETALGHWIASLGVGDQVVVVAKGAHSPFCTPSTIEPQVLQSLNRLGLDGVPIYIMHRDNPSVPVGEFVDALNRLREAGRIGVFGGSNWTVERFVEANEYAERHGLQGFSILNNNLSLAVMERPIWPGCVSSNTAEKLSWLRKTGTVHLAWSSQARGFFLPPDLRDRLPKDIGPDRCFGSAANEERRRRAELLAVERGVTPHNIATAWVLAQSFPSFALIGPRSPDELATTLPALKVGLTAEEAAWLNLEREER
ncbi:MAG: aldo/keto reductase [Pseudomonadota bacterium]